MKDYKTLYENALERVKDFTERQNPPMLDKEIMHQIFPELRESEDERIRKELIQYLKDYPNLPNGNYCRNDFFSWLEKQGKIVDEYEDKLDRCACESFDKGYKAAIEVWKDMRFEVYQQASGNRHEPNFSDDSTKMFSLTNIDEILEIIAEKQGEKTIHKNINDAALQYVDTCAVDGEVTHGNITEPYWNNHSMIAAYKAGWLEKQGEQKPTEWSEEDEHRLKDTIYFLETAKTHYASTVELDACIDWLKSLKPNHWKPSEEQMDALLYALGKGGTYNHEALTQLYNNLKTI